MFDFDASKLLIVGAIALIFIPPKDLPRVLRQVGQFIGKMRRMASEFQGQFMDAMREADMADLREEARKLASAAKVDVGLSAVSDLKNHLVGAIEGKPMMMETTSSPADPVRSVEVGPEPQQLSAGAGTVDAATASAIGAPVPAHPVPAHDEAHGADHRTEPATVMSSPAMSSSA